MHTTAVTIDRAADPATGRAAGLPWWRQLKWRVALLVTACLLCMTTVQVVWLQAQRVRDLDASGQARHVHLAGYIAQRRVQAFIDEAGQPRTQLIRDTAMYIQMIDPQLSLYLLDARGRVLDTTDTRATTLPQVDLGPVQRLLANPQALPVYGDDPAQVGRKALFSAHAVEHGGQRVGYLYLLLDTPGAATRSDWLQRDARRNVWTSLALTALTLLLLTGLLHGLLTRRLQRLAGQLAGFRADGVQAAAGSGDAARDELDHITRVAHQMQQRIDMQIQQVERSEATRRELISNIAHDLHTPLASIQAYTETLLLREDAQTADERAQRLQTIHNQCRRMGRRVQDLFELARLDAGQIQPQLEPVCLAELYSDIMQGIAMQAARQQVTLALTARADRQALVMADVGLLERALQNVLDNALRHTPQGGRVEVDIWVEGAKVLTRISDTGTGIAEADLPHIFERYWTQPAGDAPKAHRATTSAGLGLAIVKRILELHHSIIDVQSRPNVGTQFSFSLAAA